MYKKDPVTHCFATLLCTVGIQEGHLGYQRVDVLGGDRPLPRGTPWRRGRVGGAAVARGGSQLSRQRWTQGLGYGPGAWESSLEHQGCWRFVAKSGVEKSSMLYKLYVLFL